MTEANDQNSKASGDAPLENNREVESKSEAKEDGPVKTLTQDQSNKPAAENGDIDSSAPGNTNEEEKKDNDRQQENKSIGDDQPRGRYGRNRFGGGQFRRFGSRFGIAPDEYRRRWEEQQSKKPIIKEGCTGSVKWYSFRKNYGFIQRDDGEKDVFVHQLAIAKSRIRKPHLRTLANGEAVVFDVVQGKQGFEAVNVTGPDGKEVEGCRIIFVFDDFDRTPRFPPRYYNNFNNDRDRRPPYYNNYRRPAGYVRERSYDDRDREVGRLQGYRRPYPGNRPGFRDDKFDRPPYRRQRVFQGRRRSYRSVDNQKEENADAKPTSVVGEDKVDNKKINKGQFKRNRNRQYRRRVPKSTKDEGSVKDSEKSVKESSDNKEQSTAGNQVERNEKPNATDEVIQGVGNLEIKN